MNERDMGEWALLEDAPDMQGIRNVMKSSPEWLVLRLTKQWARGSLLPCAPDFRNQLQFCKHGVRWSVCVCVCVCRGGEGYGVTTGHMIVWYNVTMILVTLPSFKTCDHDSPSSHHTHSMFSVLSWHRFICASGRVSIILSIFGIGYWRTVTYKSSIQNDCYC